MSHSESGSQSQPVNSGLEGVVVAATSISDVQGLKGDLRYRGRSIDDWVQQEFAQVAAAVIGLQGHGLDFDLGAVLFEYGELSPAEAALVLAQADKHPMVVLQSLVPLLDAGPAKTLADRLAVTDSASRELLEGITIAARLPHALAILISGSPVLYPDTPDYAERFLQMLGHESVTPVQKRAFTITQILQLEHSLNAGTFAARVVASTQASLPAAISGALGALSGVLHGGADQAAIEMADAVGGAGRAAAFVQRCLADGVKIMGMGHREYKVVDPRARHVKRLAAEISAGTPHEATFATLAAMESTFAAEMAERNKPLHANLEFYKGVVYRALGAPDRSFTGLFALARVFGYVAHVVESRVGGRIIRPAARYTGD